MIKELMGWAFNFGFMDYGQYKSKSKLEFRSMTLIERISVDPRATMVGADTAWIEHLSDPTPTNPPW